MAISTLSTIAVAVLLSMSSSADSAVVNAFNQMPGYSPLPGTSQRLVGTEGCATYNPAHINWEAIRNKFIAYFRQPGLTGPENLPYSRVASLCVRAPFHDAGAFSNGMGGADGSPMITYEQNWGGNNNPFGFMPYVRAALEVVVPKYNISWADGIVMGGIAGTHFFGGKVNFDVKFGRCDSDQMNPDVLPAANLNYREYAQYWSSVGISIRDGAALVGVHSLIDDNTGGDPVAWSPSMYIAQVGGGINVTDISAPDGPSGVTWSKGVWKYTINDALTGIDNVNAECNPLPAGSCPFRSQFIQATKDFTDLNDWNEAFAGAYDRLTSIGAKWSPMSSNFKIRCINCY